MNLLYLFELNVIINKGSNSLLGIKTFKFSLPSIGAIISLMKKDQFDY